MAGSCDKAWESGLVAGFRVTQQAGQLQVQPGRRRQRADPAQGLLECFVVQQLAQFDDAFHRRHQLARIQRPAQHAVRAFQTLRDVHAVLVGRLVQQQDADRLRIQGGDPCQQLRSAHRPRAQPADEHVEGRHPRLHRHAFRQPGNVPVQPVIGQQALELSGARRILTDNDYVHYDTF